MLKNWKLSTKLAVIISILLTVIFTVQIVFTASIMRRDMNEVIYAELKALSAKNGSEAQNMLSSVETVLMNMRDYLSEMESDSAGAREYLLTEAASTVRNNEAAGIGVFSEPGVFGSTDEKNSFYLDDKALAARPPTGGYETYSETEWYTSARLGQTAVYGPYPEDGRRLLTIAVPFEREGFFAGAVKADMDVGALNRMEMDTRRYETMYGLLFNGADTVLYDSRGNSTIGMTLKEISGAQNAALIKEAAAQAEGRPFAMTIRTDQGKAVTGYFAPVEMAGETWWSLTALDTEEMEKAGREAARELSCLAFSALLVLTGVLLLLLRKRLKPIGGLAEAAQRISRGDLDIRPAAPGRDEIGILTDTFNNTARTLKAVIRDISRVLNGIAHKDLTVKPEAEYAGELSEIRTAMESIVENLNQAAEQMNQSAGEVFIGSEQLAAGAQMLAQGATEQAASVEGLAARLKELSAEIAEGAAYAGEANGRAGLIKEQAVESGRRMQELLSAIREIQDSSLQAHKIMKTMNEIAFRTKILSLNATIEAARAGSAGKGFQVVAEEVGRLAQRSGQASESTGELLNRSLSAARAGAQKAEETAEFLRSAIQSVQEITGTVGKISSAAGTQAEEIKQVMEELNGISAVVQSNSAAAQETAASSQELAGQSQLMRQQAEEFKLNKEN